MRECCRRNEQPDVSSQRQLSVGCTRYPAGVAISPRIRAGGGRLSTRPICLKHCGLALKRKRANDDPMLAEIVPPARRTVSP